MISIQKKRFELQSVVQLETSGLLSDCLKEMDAFKTTLLNRGAYSTSPVVYRILEQTGDHVKVQLLLQLDHEIQPEGQDKFIYHEIISCPNCLFMRYLPEEHDTNEIMVLLDEKSFDEDLTLDTPYYVNIPLPGGYLLDVYVPILEDKA